MLAGNPATPIDRWHYDNIELQTRVIEQFLKQPTRNVIKSMRKILIGNSLGLLNLHALGLQLNAKSNHPHVLFNDFSPF